MGIAGAPQRRILHHSVQQEPLSVESPSPAAPIPPAPKRSKIFYGWYIVGAATLAGFVNFTVFSVGQSLFIKDVRDEFS